ncbi:MAG: methylmalonyl-CoA mutase family protein [bacterium]|nr:methylmalonyl-CoA mutase family protein [bacterium]
MRNKSPEDKSPHPPPDFPTVTQSGIPLESWYGAEALEEIEPATDIGAPGRFPFTRGIRQDMYREGLWVMGQYSGYATPRETNARIKSLLAQGQKGFSIALDLPTQNGLDSDDPLAMGEVGKVGVPIDSLADMEELLDGIPLHQLHQIRTTANSIGPIAASLIIAASERLGGAPGDFRVMFQNDVLKEYVARGTQIFPPRRGLEFSVDLVEYCARHLPHWEPIEFCGYHIRDSGANAIQEVAIASANGIEYIEAALRRGLSVDDFAPNLFMFLSADLDIFEEVAKYRATRRMWAHLMRDRYGAADPNSHALNIFVYTLGGSLTAQEPLNNVSRVAFEALAAVLGGVQTLATSSYDEGIGLPSAEAAHLSLRAQQIIALETGVPRTADPLGGSYFVEWLTDQLHSKILEYMSRIADQGGAIAALESGWIGAEIEREAYALQRGIDDGTRPRIGVNRFADGVPTPTAAFAIANDGEDEQVENLRRLRADRNKADVDASLAEVRDAAATGRNSMQPILHAVKSYATVGEITSVLRDEWGTYR